MSIYYIGEKQKPLEKDAGEKTIAWLDKLRNANGSLPTSKIRLNMQRVMQNNAAVFRTQETLEEGFVVSIYGAFLFFQFLVKIESLLRTIYLSDYLVYIDSNGIWNVWPLPSGEFLFLY